MNRTTNPPARITVAATLVALALGALAAPARAADCLYGENGERPCAVERDADGSFTMTSDEFGEDTFVALGQGEPAEFERLSWNEERGQAMRLGYYNSLSDTPGCVQNVEFEADIVCAWD